MLVIQLGIIAPILTHLKLSFSIVSLITTWLPDHNHLLSYRMVILAEGPIKRFAKRSASRSKTYDEKEEPKEEWPILRFNYKEQVDDVPMKDLCWI